ncbi:MAG: transcription termination/antitermination protein NusA, partial [Leptospiraceae bacterium]|nr:transcription termination/antitermination protein NusA [Leptospiraceae bacterium]
MAKKQFKEESNILEAIQQFCAERSEKGLNISKESVFNVIKDSLAAAYKKKLGIEDDSFIQVEFIDKNEVSIIIKKKVVEGSPSGPFEISLNEARTTYPNCAVGDVLEFREKPLDSRIISNQAKQIVFQKLREMEIEQLYNCLLYTS